ncbi:MAG: biopolymer transporter ExbD [Candidatus Acidiferrum sp.]
MGISVASKGGVVAEMNVVPLIDILLVLLIICMIITPLKSQGLEAAVPQPGSDQNPPPAPEAVVVQVLNDAKTGGAGLRINSQDVAWEDLGSRMNQIFQLRAEKVAFVKGDNDVMFMDVARAIAIVRGAGVEKIGLLTAKLEAGRQ